MISERFVILLIIFNRKVRKGCQHQTQNPPRTHQAPLAALSPLLDPGPVVPPLQTFAIVPPFQGPAPVVPSHQAPPQAPGWLNLPPSVAATPDELDFCWTLLQTVQATAAHLHPNKISSILTRLWKPEGDGPFDCRFTTWSAQRAHRNVTYCVLAAMNVHGTATSAYPYPTELQILAKRLLNEYQDKQLEIRQRRNTEEAGQM